MAQERRDIRRKLGVLEHAMEPGKRMPAGSPQRGRPREQPRERPSHSQAARGTVA